MSARDDIESFSEEISPHIRGGYMAALDAYRAEVLREAAERVQSAFALYRQGLVSESEFRAVVDTMETS